MAGMQEALCCSLVWERVLCCAQKLETLGRPFVWTLWQCSGLYISNAINLFGNWFYHKLLTLLFLCWNRDMDRLYRPFLNSYPGSISTWLVRDSTLLVFKSKVESAVATGLDLWLLDDACVFYIVDFLDYDELVKFKFQGKKIIDLISKCMRHYLTNGCLV